MEVGDLVRGRGDGEIGIVIRIWSENARVVLWRCGRDGLCHTNSLEAL